MPGQSDETMAEPARRRRRSRSREQLVSRSLASVDRAGRDDSDPSPSRGARADPAASLPWPDAPLVARVTGPNGAPAGGCSARIHGFRDDTRSCVADRRRRRDPSPDRPAPAGKGTGSRRSPSHSRTRPWRDPPTPPSASTRKVASAIRGRPKTHAVAPSDRARRAATRFGCREAGSDPRGSRSTS